ncbi:MAG: hypothetical protein LUQ65_08310 [Candidatus Helarchaeota archaeon]|nr:hypothetical protein [Candidatus Helarchaeota archaeon]
MKPLLLDILACPICKFYPLKLYILKWETKETNFSNVLEATRNRDIDFLRKVTKIRRGKDRIDDAVIIKKDVKVLLKDEMVRKETNIIDYLNEVGSKLENFKVIEDYSNEKYSSGLIYIKNEVITQMINAKAKLQGKKIDDISLEIQNKIITEISSEIYLLNWYLQFAEIEEGAIFCDKCARWYPIIETIPQMLPDDLREAEAEKSFLRNWKSKLPQKIIEEGKPFNLK